jgi:hypothetical protein
MSKQMVRRFADSRDDLAEKTRSILKNVVFENFLQGEGCYLRKKANGSAPLIGYIALNEAINYRYVVHIRNSREEFRYPSVEELIRDGWRVDY